MLPGTEIAAKCIHIRQEMTVPDDLSKRSGQDRKRIDVSQEHELRDWSEKFGVSRDRLKEAVQSVGDRAEAVQEYLIGNERRLEGNDRRSGQRLGSSERRGSGQERSER